MAAPSIALSGTGASATHSAVPQSFLLCHGAFNSGESAVTQSLHLLYMAGWDILFQIVFLPMTWSTLNLWWALNLVILVWLLIVRLMNLLEPSWQNVFLLCSIPHLPWFCGHVSTLTHFPLEPGCEDYSL